MIDKHYFMLCDSITKEDRHKLNGNYQANTKFDGERIIAVKKGQDVFLINRRGREKGFIYPEVVNDLKNIDFDFIIDGEVITLDGKFNSLQFRSNLGDKEKIKKAVIENPVVFMVFDVINIKGQDIRLKPLSERIKHFEDFMFPVTKDTKLSVMFVAYEDVEKCLAYAEEKQLEGIVIKDMSSIYEHRRSHFWIKLKLFKEEEYKFVRYTENPKGIRVEDEMLNAVQVAGYHSEAVKKAIDEKIPGIQKKDIVGSPFPKSNVPWQYDGDNAGPNQCCLSIGEQGSNA